MAFIDSRKSRGKIYWSIVESKRINGKPRNFILEYLGTAETLLKRLQNEDKASIKSYSHGDTTALVNIAMDLDIVNIINKYVPANKNGKPKRDNLTVGASFLLAALGRACRPTSKRGWYDWCKETSLEYCLKSSFKNLTSQHFWDQMNLLPSESIPLIENEIVTELVSTYNIKPDCLLFDTTNFFTFIDTNNKRCDIAQRGRNKQKRNDLRQIGLALLVSRKNQFPLFHKTYQGNKNDVTVFKKIFPEIVSRVKSALNGLSDITVVFDKGNNSKENFKTIDQEKDFYYVAGLVPAHFKSLIKKANENFETISINEEDKEIPVYRIKEQIWGQERTCVVIVSKQLRKGQISGILQTLRKKYKQLNEFKQQLENPRKRKILDKDEIKKRLNQIIKGQFVDEILKYDLIKLTDKEYSFMYYVDNNSFDTLKKEILGRRILVTNRHDWSIEEIILAYRGQSKVEYAFRNFKNPFHIATRPQYHWTDQKIEIHILMCIIGYLLTIAAYSKAKKSGYKRNLHNFMEDLKTIRLACRFKNKSRKVKYQLEKIPEELEKTAQILHITNENLRPKLNLSGYM